MRSSSAAPGVRQGAKTISYEALCRQIGTLFRTGTAPVSEAETLEIFTFMEAADESLRQGAKPWRWPVCSLRPRGRQRS